MKIISILINKTITQLFLSKKNVITAFNIKLSTFNYYSSKKTV